MGDIVFWLLHEHFLYIQLQNPTWTSNFLFCKKIHSLKSMFSERMGIARDFILLSGSRPSLEMLTKLTFWNGLEAAIPAYLSAWFGGKFMNNLCLIFVFFFPSDLMS